MFEVFSSQSYAGAQGSQSLINGTQITGFKMAKSREKNLIVTTYTKNVHIFTKKAAAATEERATKMTEFILD